MDALSRGLMHGSVLENLIMGLFNLDYAMDDYEDALVNHHCT